MGVLKLPIRRLWVEQTLIPYLRYAFSHALSHEDDIAPMVQCAITFCETKPDFPTDGDDLLFERVYQAIEFPYDDLAPDLSVLTNSMEPLARYLIRRAQLKGPYELLGRKKIASVAWRENEARRLRDLGRAVKDEMQDVLDLRASTPLPPKVAITESEIDPRLLEAFPGQYLLGEVSETLTFDEDQYFRHRNRLVSEHRARAYPVQPWSQHIQHAVMSDRISHQFPDNGRAHEQQSTYSSPPGRLEAPLYVQNLGRQQYSYLLQTPVTHVRNNTRSPMGHAIQTQTFHQPLNAATKTWSSGTTQTRRENQSIYQPHQRHQQYPQPVRGPTRQAEFHTGYATTAPFSDTAEKSPWENANLRQIGSIPTEDITYLRGKDWMEAVEQRPLPILTLEVPAKSTASTEPGSKQAQPEAMGIQIGNGPEAPGFANHPGFSNIKITFPKPHFHHDV